MHWRTVVAGYLAAAAAGAAATLGTMALVTAARQLEITTALRMLVNFGASVFAIGFALALLCGLPGFMATLWTARRFGWARWPPYALAGVANVIPALGIFILAAGPPYTVPNIAIPCLVGGLAAGIVYWSIAGRAAGPSRGLPA